MPVIGVVAPEAETTIGERVRAVQPLKQSDIPPEKSTKTMLEADRMKRASARAYVGALGLVLGARYVKRLATSPPGLGDRRSLVSDDGAHNPRGAIG